MSSGPLGDIHSAEADGPSASEPELSLATLVEARGAALLDALERHLPGSRDHADGTGSYAFATAVELEATRDRAEAVREAARLHDVGKVYVPARVLMAAEEELGHEDRALLESHPAYGAKLAHGAGVPEEACEWIRGIRERFDGSGPAGLSGDGIALESRIFRAACACDALLAMPGVGSPSERMNGALEGLRAEAGGILDPRVVKALARVLGRAAGSSS